MPEVADSIVDVLRVKAVIFQTEEKTACGGSKHEVSGDVAVLPWEGADVIEDRIALLARGDQDGRGAGSVRESLRFGLLDFLGATARCCRGLSWASLFNRSERCCKVGIVAEIIVHWTAVGSASMHDLLGATSKRSRLSQCSDHLR